jgi:hypothetical protein
VRYPPRLGSISLYTDIIRSMAPWEQQGECKKEAVRTLFQRQFNSLYRWSSKAHTVAGAQVVQRSRDVHVDPHGCRKPDHKRVQGTGHCTERWLTPTTLTDMHLMRHHHGCCSPLSSQQRLSQINLPL